MTSGAARTAAKLGHAQIAAAALLVAAGGCAFAADRPLTAGVPREESAKGGETHGYRIALGTGQAAEVAVRQRDAAALELRGSAAGTQPIVLRTEAGRGSLLRVTLVADKATTWTIAVAAAHADPASLIKDH